MKCGGKLKGPNGGQGEVLHKCPAKEDSMRFFPCLIFDRLQFFVLVYSHHRGLEKWLELEKYRFQRQALLQELCLGGVGRLLAEAISEACECACPEAGVHDDQA